MSIALYAVICTATLAVLAGADESQYSNLSSCEGKPHTVSLYQAGKISPACGKVIKTGVTEEEKNEILAIHNTLRAKVASGQEKRGSPGPQPESRNLRPLQWSSELAATAQLWANQCQHKHDMCRNTPAYDVGQIVAQHTIFGQASGSLTSSVQAWSDDVQYFDRNLVSSYVHDERYATYTQMVWGKTTHVGCGAIVFGDDGFMITTSIVCNYGPAGNILRQPVY